MPELTLIYDGACPLCNSYVRYMRLRKAAGKLTLIDARKHPQRVTDLASKGIDLNQGMVVEIDKKLYVGGDALHVLALLSGRSNLFNKMNAWLFSRALIAQRIYPFLRAGRIILLKMLGIPMIDTSSDPVTRSEQ